MPKATLIELEKREIQINQGDKDIYHNGKDNDYPERIERIINNSVTAKLAANKMSDFLVGRGFSGDLNTRIINHKGETFFSILKKVARSISYQKGFALHVNYDIEGVVNHLEFIPFKRVRISKEDDHNNQGLIWVKKEWKKSESGFGRGNKGGDKKKYFYPYSSKTNVINAQRDRDFEIFKSNQESINFEELSVEQLVEMKISSYRGQIYFCNLEDENIYPNAYIDAAYNDADTEYRLSVFRNDLVRNGFIGATIVTVADAGNEADEIVSDEQLKGLLGSENASNLLKISADVADDGKLKELVKVDQVKAEIDTERFKYDEEKIQENILNQFNNIPKILVRNSDSSLFGASGEAMRVAQNIYNEETREERETIEQVFNALFVKNTEFGEFNINPLITNDTNSNQA